MKLGPNEFWCVVYNSLGKGVKTPKIGCMPTKSVEPLPIGGMTVFVIDGYPQLYKAKWEAKQVCDDTRDEAAPLKLYVARVEVRWVVPVKVAK